MISLNAGTKETYKWLMRADKRDLVVDNIQNFLAIRKESGSGPKIIIQIMETKKTNPEVREFKKFWEPRIGANDSIWVRPLLNWGGKINTKDMLVKEKGKRYPCYSLWGVISIDKDGNVYPCCEGFSSRENSDLLLGNVHEKSFMQIYSENIEKFRKMHLNGQWDEISVCSKCDFWSFSPNIYFRIGRRWF